MRKVLFLISVFLYQQSSAQLIANPQLPPMGLVYKPQLWTMVLTNTKNAPIIVHMEVTLSNAKSGQPVMSGVTKAIQVAPGTIQVNASVLKPIQYSVLSPVPIDADPEGLLPIGNFDACYTFFEHRSDVVTEIAEQCREVFIEPLGPPQLIYPYNQTAIEEKMPQFSWLPPFPLFLFSNLRYDLSIVELYPNQSPLDAIGQNIPYFQQSNLFSTSLLYPQSAPGLALNKQYAWRITAKNNDVPVSYSEVWQFSLKQFQKAEKKAANESPYIKLRKEGEPGYAIFSGELKFDYLNETADSIWKIKVFDLSKPKREFISLSLDSVSLVPGRNLVKYKAEDHPYFIDKHFYLLEVFNSRKETWHLRFEYRKPKSQQ